MLSKPIKNFIRNVEELRDFITLVSGFIEKGHRERIKADAQNLVPVLLAFKEFGDSKFSLPDGLTDDKLKELFGADFSIKVESDDGKVKSVNIEVDDSANERFSKALKKFFLPFNHQDNLYKNGLVSLLSYVEWFLSGLIHQFYENRPTDSHVRDKSITFDDLKKIGSIEDAKKYLVDKEVEGVLRGDIDDWFAYLKTKLSLSMSYLDGMKDDLIEMQKRRNIIVHNGGVANSIYINSLPEKHRAAFKVGESVPVTKEYLDDAINLFEKAFVLIGLELWKNCEKHSKAREDFVTYAQYSHLCEERYSIGEGICKFAIGDKGLEGEVRTISLINYWLSLKFQGKLSDVIEEIRKSDFSDKKMKFELARQVLLGDFEKACEMLSTLLDTKEITQQDLREWPLFKDLRKEERFKAYIVDPEPPKIIPAQPIT